MELGEPSRLRSQLDLQKIETGKRGFWPPNAKRLSCGFSLQFWAFGNGRGWLSLGCSPMTQKKGRFTSQHQLKIPRKFLFFSTWAGNTVNIHRVFQKNIYLYIYIYTYITLHYITLHSHRHTYIYIYIPIAPQQGHLLLVHQAPRHRRNQAMIKAWNPAGQKLLDVDRLYIQLLVDLCMYIYIYIYTLYTLYIYIH